MKRFICLLLVLLIISPYAVAEEEKPKGFWGSVGDWFNQAAEDTTNWATQAWEDTSEWVTNAADDVADWTAGTANDVWNGVTGFFDPPSTEGVPNIAAEPVLPAGTQKMYLGYKAVKTGLNNGYSDELAMGKDDPNFGLDIGKFYVSGYTRAEPDNDKNFIFLKTVGDKVELHFELAQDINMIGNDTSAIINQDIDGYDLQMGIGATDFGRGTLIVKFTDYQNKTGKPQVYTDYLSAKMTGKADTVISLNEEGDYEIALDYEIKKDNYILGTKLTRSSLTNYRIHFTFKVRNGNCMVFPFDSVTKAELQNASITPNGFYLDLARSRYLDINVSRTVMQNGQEDIRFNRPARDGDQYTAEGIYTISVSNKYTDESTTKTIFVGSDELLQQYVAEGFSMDRLQTR